MVQLCTELTKEDERRMGPEHARTMSGVVALHYDHQNQSANRNAKLSSEVVNQTSPDKAVAPAEVERALHVWDHKRHTHAHSRSTKQEYKRMMWELDDVALLLMFMAPWTCITNAEAEGQRGTLMSGEEQVAGIKKKLRNDERYGRLETLVQLLRPMQPLQRSAYLRELLDAEVRKFKAFTFTGKREAVSACLDIWDGLRR